MNPTTDQEVLLPEPVELSYGEVVTAETRQQVFDQTTYMDQHNRRKVTAASAADSFCALTQAHFIRYDAATTSGYFRRWNGRFWEEYPLLSVQADIREIWDCTISMADEIIKTAKTIEPIHIGDLDKSNYGVMLQKRIIQVGTNGKLTQADHGPERRNTWVIDQLAQKMQTPTWDSVLKRVAPDQEVRDLVQEMFGYVLHAGLNYQTIFVLYGPGKTGKTTVVRVLEDILGPTNVASISVDALDGEHTTSGLLGKRLNTSEEASYASKKAENLLKSISGGASVGLNIKNGPYLSRTLDCVWVIPTNEIPKFTDRSNAIWQRLVIIPFEQKLDLEAWQTPNQVVQSLRGEYPGIILWALEGLKRLAARTHLTRADKFTQTARGSELLKQHRRESDPWLTWFNLRVIQWVGYKTPKKDAYDGYRYWYETNMGHERGVLGSIAFYRRMAQELADRKWPGECRPRNPDGTNGARSYPDIKVLQETEADTAADTVEDA